VLLLNFKVVSPCSRIEDRPTRYGPYAWLSSRLGCWRAGLDKYLTLLVLVPSDTPQRLNYLFDADDNYSITLASALGGITSSQDETDLDMSCLWEEGSSADGAMCSGACGAMYTSGCGGMWTEACGPCTLVVVEACALELAMAG
jgi:hypothetical protein